MRKSCILFTFFTLSFGIFNQTVFAQQRGYHNAPYTRYEAENGTLVGASATTSYNQADIAFEASDRTAVNLRNGNSVEWNVTGNFNRLGIVIRYSVAGVTNHTENRTANVQVFVGGQLKTTLTVNTYYSWEDLKNNGNANNNGISNTNWRMRFDEVRYRVDTPYPSGTTVKLVSQSNDLWIDFIEAESVPEPKTAASQGANATFTAGGNLQTFIDNNGNKTIYIPEGTHNINRDLYLGVANTKLVGAGMWYTTIHFTSKNSLQGGIHFSKDGQDVKDLSLSSNNNSRHSDNSNSSGYKGFWGSTRNATIENVWVEHFECGAWMAGYGGEGVTSNITFKHCRFRNNYADGINFCKGANNNLAEYCSFRNNGDDDMAVWPANHEQCYNNTYRYNTAENCWRASSCALYGGYGNKWQNIIVKDNYEVGIRVNGHFAGACFSDNAANEFSNIDVIGCGTPNNTYGSPEPAVDITTAGSCSDLRNIDFSCINIQNSKFDAIYFRKETGGNQIRNISMNGITINGTNRYGQTQNTGWGNAAGIRFIGTPSLNNVSFCGSFANIQNQNVLNAPAGGWSLATTGCITCTSTQPTVQVYLNNCPVNALATGSTVQLSATVTGTTNTAVNWTSSNNNIASVNNLGLVTTGAQAGNVTITATSAADNSKKAECSIAVSPTAPPTPFDLIVEDFYWTPEAPQVGQQVVFSAIIKNIGETATPNGVKHGISFTVNNADGTQYPYSTTWNDRHNTSIAAGQSVTLTATGGIGAQTVGNAWVPNAKGTYQVVAYVNDDNSISNEQNRSNNQLVESVVVIDEQSGVKNIETSGKTIISNNGNIEIQGIEIGEKVAVYNVLGIKIYSQTATQNPMIISDLQSGIYIIFIENKNISAKVVVNKHK